MNSGPRSRRAARPAISVPPRESARREPLDGPRGKSRESRSQSTRSGPGSTRANRTAPSRQARSAGLASSVRDSLSRAALRARHYRSRCHRNARDRHPAPRARTSTGSGNRAPAPVWPCRVETARSSWWCRNRSAASAQTACRRAGAGAQEFGVFRLDRCRHQRAEKPAKAGGFGRLRQVTFGQALVAASGFRPSKALRRRPNRPNRQGYAHGAGRLESRDLRYYLGERLQSSGEWPARACLTPCSPMASLQQRILVDELPSSSLRTARQRPSCLSSRRSAEKST